MKPQFEVAQLLQKQWANIEQSKSFNSHQIRMLSAIRRCRTSELGWHIDQCNHCSHLKISYNSCRNRNCPKCQGSKREEWIHAQQQKLLPVKYFHVVFTLPDALNPLCLGQSKLLYSILFESAWATIKTFSKDRKFLGAATGMTSILHTWGQNLSLHPHLHCIIPAGGITKYGKWKHSKSKGKFLFPVQAMSLVFRAVFVKKLRKKAKKEGLVLPKSLFDQLFAKKWVVFAKQPFLGPNQIIEYIGRYTHKIAISNHRIQNIADGKVVFKYKDYRKSGQNKMMTLSQIEFIRRFSLHILPHRFTRIRHFGILNAKSNFSIPHVIAAIKNTGMLTVQISKANIAKHIKILPKCPICKHGNMHILVFGSGLDPPPDLGKLKQNIVIVKI